MADLSLANWSLSAFIQSLLGHHKPAMQNNAHAKLPSFLSCASRAARGGQACQLVGLQERERAREKNVLPLRGRKKGCRLCNFSQLTDTNTQRQTDTERAGRKLRPACSADLCERLHSKCSAVGCLSCARQAWPRAGERQSFVARRAGRKTSGAEEAKKKGNKQASERAELQRRQSGTTKWRQKLARASPAAAAAPQGEARVWVGLARAEAQAARRRPEIIQADHSNFWLVCLGIRAPAAAVALALAVAAGRQAPPLPARLLCFRRRASTSTSRAEPSRARRLWPRGVAVSVCRLFGEARPQLALTGRRGQPAAGPISRGSFACAQTRSAPSWPAGSLQIAAAPGPRAGDNEQWRRRRRAELVGLTPPEIVSRAESGQKWPRRASHNSTCANGRASRFQAQANNIWPAGRPVGSHSHANGRRRAPLRSCVTPTLGRHLMGQLSLCAPASRSLLFAQARPRDSQDASAKVRTSTRG